MFLHRGAQADKDPEKSEEVHKSADCNDGTMLVLAYEVNHVSDDQLRHDLQDHVFIEIFAGASLAHIAHGMLEQVNKSLVGVDVLDHSLVLSSLFVKFLFLDIIRLFLSEKKRKPVSKSF